MPAGVIVLVVPADAATVAVFFAAAAADVPGSATAAVAPLVASAVAGPLAAALGRNMGGLRIAPPRPSGLFLTAFPPLRVSAMETAPLCFVIGSTRTLLRVAGELLRRSNTLLLLLVPPLLLFRNFPAELRAAAVTDKRFLAAGWPTVTPPAAAAVAALPFCSLMAFAASRAGSCAGAPPRSRCCSVPLEVASLVRRDSGPVVDRLFLQAAPLGGPPRGGAHDGRHS